MILELDNKYIRTEMIYITTSSIYKKASEVWLTVYLTCVVTYNFGRPVKNVTEHFDWLAKLSELCAPMSVQLVISCMDLFESSSAP